ncbi:hypothetical protein SLS60_009781 [Paraconiothyrium brasiliense]|uniref:Uncharacterized protein n=1 Tax=Paraconiothyrium brasiliense TaxID=300254 RepID=A0ABR3QT76_9PLEO
MCFSEKELVWLEPWTGCAKNLVTVLCEYGKDFNVFKKNGGTDTLEAARQHSSEPTATEVHAVRAKFDDFEALNMRIPDRRPSSSQLLYRRLPRRDAFQQQGLRGSFWEENVKTVEIYTVRMSLAVLAKAPHDGQTFCTMGFGGRNAMDIWRNFDPPRLGYYD